MGATCTGAVLACLSALRLHMLVLFLLVRLVAGLVQLKNVKDADCWSLYTQDSSAERG